ncbi:MAG TPA: polyphosphate polymerase domain-containing protein [Humisphaera sp.]
MPFADHMQRNRYELKYLIDESTARGVRDFMRPHMIRDPHAKAASAWAYPIYSVYLDGPSLPLYDATVHGHKNRFKLRARYYDAKPTNPVFFEVKRRVHDVIIKERSAVRRSSVGALLAGRPPVPSDLQDPSDSVDFAALQHFCHLQHSVRGTGRAVVAYTREAWNAPGNDDVRVTFDRDVAGAWFDPDVPIDAALRPDRRWAYPPVEGGGVVLELKFTGRFPLWMKDLVASFDLYRGSMAKYAMCVVALGPQAHGRWRDRQVPAALLETHY